MAAKYKDIVNQLRTQHAEELAQFKNIHDQYVSDRKKFQEEFNTIGVPIRHLMEEYERKLCGQTERGAYASYSHKLAEKFWNEIKKDFPYIDFVGMRTLS